MVDFLDGGIGVEVGSFVREGAGEIAREGLGSGGGVVQGLEAEGSFGRVARFGEAEFF